MKKKQTMFEAKHICVFTLVFRSQLVVEVLVFRHHLDYNFIYETIC